MSSAPASPLASSAMARRRRIQTVPTDDDGAGLLACVEPQQEFCEAPNGARALPSLRRIVFGNAWYDRCAKESPSITSNGRPESTGLPTFAARCCRLAPVRRMDSSASGNVAANVACPPTFPAETRPRPASFRTCVGGLSDRSPT